MVTKTQKKFIYVLRARFKLVHIEHPKTQNFCHFCAHSWVFKYFSQTFFTIPGAPSGGGLGFDGRIVSLFFFCPIGLGSDLLRERRRMLDGWVVVRLAQTLD